MSWVLRDCPRLKITVIASWVSCVLGVEKKCWELSTHNLDYLNLFQRDIDQLSHVRKYSPEKWKMTSHSSFPLLGTNVQSYSFHEKYMPSSLNCSNPSTVITFPLTSQTTLFIISFNHSFLITILGDLLFRIMLTHLWMEIVDYYHKLTWTLKMLGLEE